MKFKIILILLLLIALMLELKTVDSKITNWKHNLLLLEQGYAVSTEKCRHSTSN